MHFIECKYLYFVSYIIEVCFRWTNRQKVINDSNNDFVPLGIKTIIWTTVGRGLWRHIWSLTGPNLSETFRAELWEHFNKLIILTPFICGPTSSENWNVSPITLYVYEKTLYLQILVRDQYINWIKNQKHVLRYSQFIDSGDKLCGNSCRAEFIIRIIEIC